MTVAKFIKRMGLTLLVAISLALVLVCAVSYRGTWYQEWNPEWNTDWNRWRYVFANDGRLTVAYLNSGAPPDLSGNKRISPSYSSHRDVWLRGGEQLEIIARMITGDGSDVSPQSPKDIREKGALIFDRYIHDASFLGFFFYLDVSRKLEIVVRFPVWIAVFPVAVMVIPIISIQRRRWWLRRRQRSGLCLICGYQLKGNESGRCPECGTATVAVGVSERR